MYPSLTQNRPQLEKLITRLVHCHGIESRGVWALDAVVPAGDQLRLN